MKTLLCFLAAFALLVLNAHALLVKLDRPGVAMRADIPQEVQLQIQSALERKDCKFLGGHGLNSHTSLSYSGETLALNLFLEGLARCPGVTVSVSFTNDSLPHADSDWHVSHMADENKFHVRVNLKSARVQLDKLVLPESKGPALPAKSVPAK